MNKWLLLLLFSSIKESIYLNNRSLRIALVYLLAFRPPALSAILYLLLSLIHLERIQYSNQQFTKREGKELYNLVSYTSSPTLTGDDQNMKEKVQPQSLAHPFNTLTVCTSGSILRLWSTLLTPSLYVPLGPASAFGPPFQHPHCMYLWVQPQPLVHPSNTLTVCTSGSSLNLWPTLPTPSLYVPLDSALAFGPPFQHPHCMYLIWVQP